MSTREMIQHVLNDRSLHLEDSKKRALESRFRDLLKDDSYRTESVTQGVWTHSEDPGTETRLALWIRFEGEAMQTPLDASVALEKVVAKLRDNEYDGTILDYNGNSVGAWDIEAFQH